MNNKNHQIKIAIKDQFLMKIKNTRSDTNCSGFDYDGMCGIRKI